MAPHIDLMSKHVLAVPDHVYTPGMYMGKLKGLGKIQKLTLQKIKLGGGLKGQIKCSWCIVAEYSDPWPALLSCL